MKKIIPAFLVCFSLALSGCSGGGGGGGGGAVAAANTNLIPIDGVWQISATVQQDDCDGTPAGTVETIDLIFKVEGNKLTVADLNGVVLASGTFDPATREITASAVLSEQEPFSFEATISGATQGALTLVGDMISTDLAVTCLKLDRITGSLVDVTIPVNILPDNVVDQRPLGVTTGDTSTEIGAFEPSCAQPNTPDLAFLFVADSDSDFIFNLSSGDFEPAIALFETDSVTEIACADDASLASITRAMSTGDQVVIVCDSRDGNTGAFSLDVVIAGGPPPPPPVCPTIGTLTLDLPETGSNVGAPDDYTESCVIANHDVGYNFTAPSTGEFNFNTAGSDYDTTLAAFATDCTTSLGCNDDSSGLLSSINLPLNAGDQVIIVVSGNLASQGNYVLNATEVVSSPLPACVTNEIFLGSPQFGSTAGESDDFQISCSTGGDGNDAEFGFIAPSAGSYTFTTIGTTFDSLLEVRADDCTTSLGCDDAFPVLGGEFVTVTLAAGQAVVVIVDGFGGLTGNYTLQVNQ